jgi:TatD DNase family protein
VLRWIDTHCHLDAPEFALDLAQVRHRAARAGVVHCVIPTVLPAHFDHAAQLAHEHGDSFALGIHPLYVQAAPADSLRLLERALVQYANDPRLVAVGETGLDYFVPALMGEQARQKQWVFYIEQLRMAKAFGLPVLLHVRRSVDDILKGLRQVQGQQQAPVSWGIAHAFNGSEQQAQRCVAAGLKLGFGGTLTYAAANSIRKLARQLPLSDLVLETDAPDILPQWLYTTVAQREAGVPQGRNEPGELAAIGNVLAELRQTPVNIVAKANWDNALQALPKLAELLPVWNESYGS